MWYITSPLFKSAPTVLDALRGFLFALKIQHQTLKIHLSRHSSAGATAEHQPPCAQNLIAKKIQKNISFCLTINALHINISLFPQGNRQPGTEGDEDEMILMILRNLQFIEQLIYLLIMICS
ncbi:MAG: hypothetical protein E7031_02420 [Akkermansiaceae bacterium]|nr:hypothetical protein [Akkermansiaceae bacterium]